MMAKHICWAVFRVVLSAWRCVPPSLSFRTATLWAFQLPFLGPVPSKALLLSIVLVFGVLFEAFPYQICRLQLSYLETSQISLFMTLFALLPKRNAKSNTALNRANSLLNLWAMSACFHHISPSSLFSLDIPHSLPASSPVYWPF